MTDVLIPCKTDIEQLTTLAIVIHDEASYDQGNEDLAVVRKMQLRLDADTKLLKRPFQEGIDKIEAAAKPLRQMLSERYAAVHRALIEYKKIVRAKVQQYNTKALDKFEKKAAEREAEAIAKGQAPPLELPPALKAEPERVVETAVGQNIESGYWKWTGIKGVADPDKLTFAEASRLNLDLPADWFTLDRAKVTACVKRQDRVPSCVIQHFEEKIVVRGK